jgi:membrane-bound serine protease (ClpP class)
MVFPDTNKDMYRFLLLLLLLLPTSLKSSIEDSLKSHILYQKDQENKIGYIVIEDRSSGINDSTWLYVKQALDYYKQHPPIFIILELNTPGGEVFAAQKISDALKNFDTQYNVPVVAFINNWAISAGAMLAYSCRYITVVKDGSMGAAEPLLSSQTGEMKEASEKVNSALRADFGNRAMFFDRDPNIAEAMVDKDIILVWRNNQVVRLDNENKIESSDVIISPKGKLLTLNAKQLIEYKVADLLLLPKRLDPITESEREKGVWPAKKMLLFTAPFFTDIPNAIIDAYQMDWKTKFFVYLANPVVSSLLLLGLMLGFYMEVSSPGFGFPATLAIICLTLLVLSHLSLEIANWLEVILLFLGLTIILVDIFIFPTFGVLGVFGILLFLGGLFGMLLPQIGSVNFDFDTKTLNAAGEAFLTRLAGLSLTILIGILLMFLLGRFFTPRFATWTRLVLKGSEQEGYIAGDAVNLLPKIGEKGIAFTLLRPAGKVIINNHIYDALSQGSFIEKDTPIKVLYLDGSTIIVVEDR